MSDARELLKLIGEFDATIWASEFCKLFSLYTEDGVIEDKEGLMVTWFANAIMAGYDRGQADVS